MAVYPYFYDMTIQLRIEVIAVNKEDAFNRTYDAVADMLRDTTLVQPDFNLRENDPDVPVILEILKTERGEQLTSDNY